MDKPQNFLFLSDITSSVRLSPLCGTSGTVTDPNVYDIGTYQLIGSISFIFANLKHR